MHTECTSRVHFRPAVGKHLQARRSLLECLQIAPLCTKIAPSIAPRNRHGDHRKTLRIMARPGQDLLVRNTFNTKTASRRWTASEESHGHGKVDGRLLARDAIRCQLEKAINSDAPAALIGQLKACCATLCPRRDARKSARRTCLIAGIGDSKANPRHLSRGKCIDLISISASTGVRGVITRDLAQNYAAAVLIAPNALAALDPMTQSTGVSPLTMPSAGQGL